MTFEQAAIALVTISRIVGTLIQDGKRDPTPEEVAEIRAKMDAAEEAWHDEAPPAQPE